MDSSKALEACDKVIDKCPWMQCSGLSAGQLSITQAGGPAPELEGGPADAAAAAACCRAAMTMAGRIEEVGGLEGSRTASKGEGGSLASGLVPAAGNTAILVWCNVRAAGRHDW